jgi:hypothetical protein
MKLTYKTADNEETALLKCNVLQDNQMQCNHKVSKIVTIDDRTGIPPLFFVNLPTNNGILAYCQAHFNILASDLVAKDGDIIENLDKIEV